MNVIFSPLTTGKKFRTLWIRTAGSLPEPISTLRLALPANHPLIFDQRFSSYLAAAIACQRVFWIPGHFRSHAGILGANVQQVRTAVPQSLYPFLDRRPQLVGIGHD